MRTKRCLLCNKFHRYLSQPERLHQDVLNCFNATAKGEAEKRILIFCGTYQKAKLCHKYIAKSENATIYVPENAVGMDNPKYRGTQ